MSLYYCCPYGIADGSKQQHLRSDCPYYGDGFATSDQTEAVTTSAEQSEEVVWRTGNVIKDALGLGPTPREVLDRAALAALSVLDLPTIQRDARREALEEAARVAERIGDGYRYGPNMRASASTGVCGIVAADIRALAQKEQNDD